jgi:group I intron endonuclease
MKSGIYSIRNTVTGKRYVGSAVNLRMRVLHHRDALCRGDHRNVLLQRAWNKYGAEAFEVRTVLFCAPALLLMYEQRCIDSFKPEYNICKVAGSRIGTKYSDEAKERLKRLRKAAPRSLKQLEHLATLAERARGRPGRTLTDEVRQKISASLTGKKQSPECIEKRAVALRGLKRSDAARAAISAGLSGKKRKPLSPEHKAKIGAASKGRKHTPEAIVKMSMALKESHRKRKENR